MLCFTCLSAAVVLMLFLFVIFLQRYFVLEKGILKYGKSPADVRKFVCSVC